MRPIEELIRQNKGPIMFLLLLIAVIGAVVGFKYYRYTQENPEYCSLCHLTQEGFKSWQRGPHRLHECQTCHSMGVMEQNKLLLAFVMGRGKKVSQGHGRVSPWTACRNCHLTAIAQGSVTLKNSYGHARHVFMHEIGCDKCHRGDLHVFNVSQSACIECHKEKLVHGMGMEGLKCLNCHSYAESAPKMTTSRRCLKCHRPLPQQLPMSNLSCYECHKPHGKLKMTNDDCLGRCHGNESKVGQHGRHMKKTKLGCTDCHRPHTWVVGTKQAAGLCDRCHALKDPATFVY